MKLSFIIPLYNAEKYIASCLDNILQVESPSVCCEVIVVDDGSTDSGPEIVGEYAGKNGNIRLFHQENGGPATARNTGLDNAEGEYVWFVDADDAIEPMMADRLKEACTRCPHLDMVSFSYIEHYPDRDVMIRKTDKERLVTGLEMLSQMGCGFLWHNIYRREAIGEGRFITGVRHIEDYCFNQLNVIDFEKVMVVPEVGYHYNRKNTGSISHDRRLRDRVRANDDSFVVYKAMHDRMLSLEDGPKRQHLFRELNFSIAAHLYTMFRFDNARTMKRYISLYRTMGLYPLKRTGNRKSDLFLLVANRERLLLTVKRLLCKLLGK